MRTVWKSVIPVDDGDHRVRGTIVHVAPGHTPDHVLVWHELDPDSLNDPWHHYRVFGTGHPLTDAKEHVGSVRHHPFVWHVYRVSR